MDVFKVKMFGNPFRDRLELEMNGWLGKNHNITLISVNNYFVEREGKHVACVTYSVYEGNEVE